MMPPQFDKYRDRVYQAYLKKKREGVLSLHLEDPKPAHLRDECLRLLPKRQSKNDSKILSDFFGEPQDGKSYNFTIYQFDLKYLKPLRNFLVGDSKTTGKKNINLLAWLIDFPDRPYRFDYEPVLEEEEFTQQDLDTVGQQVASVNTNKPEDIASDKEITNPKTSGFVEEKKGVMLKEGKERPWKRRLQLRSLIAIVAIICIGLSISFFTDGGYLNNLFGNHCMYWSADHYESIDCDAHATNVLVIALDRDKLLHFKKITRIDTLTQDCVGKIWYSKISNEVEFFTSSGRHPMHTEKGLKIVTAYIYQTYIAKKDSTTNQQK